MPPFQLRTAYRPTLDPAPLAGVCLLLLLFLMLLARLSYVAGDSVAATSDRQTLPPVLKSAMPAIRVRLTADKQGELTGIRMDERPVGSLRELHDRIRRTVRRLGRAGEVEFDCDYRLRYAHVLRAIAAVSGYRADDGKTTEPLIEKVKFAPLRREQAPD